MLRRVIDRTGYQRMLEADPSPETESRIGNLQELLNAAADATERGETLSDFLDHAALVSDADQVDNEAQVSLLTIHNAKGLEFPIVFLREWRRGCFLIADRSRTGTDGRRAPALLRGNDARREVSVHLACAIPTAAGVAGSPSRAFRRVSLLKYRSRIWSW